MLSLGISSALGAPVVVVPAKAGIHFDFGF